MLKTNRSLYLDFYRRNKRIANERIKEAEGINAEAVRDAQFHFARELRKK